MAILALPTQPAMQSSRFGLVSNSSTFISPLTGQTQTIERPGARWQATYTLPPMKRAEAARWQAFLLQLRGGAGRFYAHDPDAVLPRGASLQSNSDSRNEIRNGDALGAVAGGSLPTYWQFGAANGLAREVVGSGTEGDISYVEVRFYGTPTASFTALSFETATQVAVSEGEVWCGGFSYRLSAGSMSNISALNMRFEQSNASNGTVLQSHYVGQAAPDASWRRANMNRTMTDTTPDSTRLRPALHLTLTAGLPIDITLRVGAVQLEKQNSPSLYIPTRGAARSRSSGARVNGEGQSGTVLNSWNWQPNIANVLRAGDYVAFDTPAGRALHMLVSDASSDAKGQAVLNIEPPLRTAPSDNTALMLARASAVMGLVENSVQWEANEAGTYRLSFSAEERF